MIRRRKSNQFQAFSTSIFLSLSSVLQFFSLLVRATVSLSAKGFDDKRKTSSSLCESPIALSVLLPEEEASKPVVAYFLLDMGNGSSQPLHGSARHETGYVRHGLFAIVTSCAINGRTRYSPLKEVGLD